MKAIFATALILAASPAMADGYEPFQIDEKMYRELMTYLGDVPSKYANPLISAFERKEKEAAQAKAAADAKPKEEPK